MAQRNTPERRRMLADRVAEQRARGDRLIERRRQQMLAWQREMVRKAEEAKSREPT